MDELIKLILNMPSDFSKNQFMVINSILDNLSMVIPDTVGQDEYRAWDIFSDPNKFASYIRFHINLNANPKEVPLDKNETDDIVKFIKACVEVEYFFSQLASNWGKAHHNEDIATDIEIAWIVEMLKNDVSKAKLLQDKLESLHENFRKLAKEYRKNNAFSTGKIAQKLATFSAATQQVASPKSIDVSQKAMVTEAKEQIKIQEAQQLFATGIKSLSKSNDTASELDAILKENIIEDFINELIANRMDLYDKNAVNAYLSKFAQKIFEKIPLSEIAIYIDKIATLFNTEEDTNNFKQFLLYYQIEHASKIAKWQSELFFGKELYQLMHPGQKHKSPKKTPNILSLANKFFQKLENKPSKTAIENQIYTTQQTRLKQPSADAIFKKIENTLNNNKIFSSNDLADDLKNAIEDSLSQSQITPKLSKILVNIEKSNNLNLRNLLPATLHYEPISPSLSPIIGNMIDAEKIYRQQIYQQYIESISKQILESNWKLGKIGGEPLRDANGIELRDEKTGKPILRPKNVARIYNKHCVIAENDQEWEKHFKAIAVIGHYAKSHHISFFGLNKRTAGTKHFYESLTKYAEKTELTEPSPKKRKLNQ